jgi:polyisoprenoid-binding protein YceI
MHAASGVSPGVCGADAQGEIDRADFGMAQYTDNGMGRIRMRIQVEALKDADKK